MGQTPWSCGQPWAPGKRTKGNLEAATRCADLPALPPSLLSAPSGLPALPAALAPAQSPSRLPPHNLASRPPPSAGAQPRARGVALLPLGRAARPRPFLPRISAATSGSALPLPLLFPGRGADKSAELGEGQRRIRLGVSCTPSPPRLPFPAPVRGGRAAPQLRELGGEGTALAADRLPSTGGGERLLF